MWFHRIAELTEELQQVQLRGVLGPVRTVGEKQGRRLTATLTDPSGSVDLVWFKGIRWLQASLKPGQEYVVFGKPSVFKGRFNLAHPELELAATWDQGLEAALQPVYSTTEKLIAKGLDEPCDLEAAEDPVAAGDRCTCRRTLSRRTGGLAGRHLPRGGVPPGACSPGPSERLELAIRRLKFEELFFIQLQLLEAEAAAAAAGCGAMCSAGGRALQHLLHRNTCPSNSPVHRSVW